MRVLVLHAHPVSESFNGALHRRAVERLEAAGHDVDDCNLYAEDFDPRLTREERLGYHDIGANTAPVQGHVDRLRAADALVLCYPVWNFGYPAMLKGYFDRVFLPGVSFTMDQGQVRPCLHNIGKVAVITTYGGSRTRAILMGDPPRKLANRVLRVIVKPGAPFSYLAHYDMNRSTDETRRRFMHRVGQAMDRF
ncbi:flavodoxin family protein [Oceaniradius stylonematis]|jgi:NAD(P)H dehydrogenase (quinone)|uniref:Flavodoxin family protein n=1 Tax=Oceaniradius stylonematis TaxID=2184161 RepID=A0A3A8A6Y2_9HYPH|nr:NAD(P)H-dependent oxidoreductase [Oceaniradius stylonematis]RKF05616.1 flavodoxin family protein [Oceaniradius stylonematis]